MRNSHILGIYGENGAGKSTLMDSFQNQYFQKSILIWQGSFKTQSHLKVRDLFEMLKTEEKLYFSKMEAEIDFDQWHLTKILDRPINKLSGGENQTVKILSSVLMNKEYYLFDEPFSFLDQGRKDLFKSLLKKLQSFHKKLIIIDHDLAVLNFLCDDVYELTNYQLIKRQGS